MKNSAYVGMGSNLGSRLENCQQAMTYLEEHPAITVLASSSFYETEPVGKTDQGWFLNAVVQVSTELEPEALLESLLEIETAMGRVRNEKWGPRIIDLDLLLYEDRILKAPRLEVPHPEMTQRRFVLAPLCELAAGHMHPLAKKTIQQLLSELPEDEKVFITHTST
jgi:2-amino-4-hydroxy-6-hydroxymethyldihydropteridine diphosphokinase